MDDLTALSVDRFLDAVAERTPIPGGGGVTAAAGALSCAMGRMVAAYSVQKQTDPAVRARVESVAQRLRNADELFRALVTRDAEVYTRMTAAAKKAREDPGARGNYTEAIVAAIGVPLQMAALAADALSAMDECKTAVNRYLLSDLGVAGVLAEATARAAGHSKTGAPGRSSWRTLTRRCRIVPGPARRSSPSSAIISKTLGRTADRGADGRASPESCGP